MQVIASLGLRSKPACSLRYQPASHLSDTLEKMMADRFRRESLTNGFFILA
jgi:hypothetical protein